MKTVLLIRHAKSSWDDPSMPDFDRPLNNRGEKDADSMSRRLARQIKFIDAFFSSPAKRAKTTAKAFADAFNASKKLSYAEGLYLAPSSFFYSFISQAHDDLDTIALFAHNPGITDFANSLSTEASTDNIPTCGIFAVSIDITYWKDFEGAKKKLLFYDYPKLHS